MKSLLKGLMLTLAALVMYTSCTKNEEQPIEIRISKAALVEQKLEFTVNIWNADDFSYEIESEGAIIASKSGLSPAKDGADNNLSVSIENAGEELLIRAKAFRGDAFAFDEYTLKNESGDPEDEDPSEESFFKKVNILQFTATWCSICPKMVNSLNKLNTKYPERTSIIAIHGQDDLTVIPSSSILMKEFNITGFPTAIIDYNTQSDFSYTRLQKRVKDEVKKFPATTNIKLTSALQGQQVDLKAEIKNKQAEAQYKYVCAIIEDGIIFEGGTAEDNTYNHVLRKFYTDEKGSAFKNASGTETETLPTDAPTTVNLQCELDSSWKAENCKIVFFTLKYNASEKEWIVDNSNIVKIGESADFLGPETGIE